MLETPRRAIVPFWNRIPRFFLYPLQPGALLLLAGITLALIVLPAGLLGWLLRLVILLFFVKYCLEILAETAEGRFKAPPLSWTLFSEGYALPLKLYAIFFLLGALQSVLIDLLGFWAVSVVGLLASLILPAMIMVLAVSGSLLAALTPPTVFGLIWRIGWPYLALFGLLNMLSASLGGAFMLLEGRLEPVAHIAVVLLLGLYTVVIAHHLMGYVVYQYQDALGYSTDDQEQADDPALADYRRFIAAQNYPAALEELRRLVNNQWDDLELHRRLHKLAALIPNADILIRHGHEFIPMLLQRNLVREAMEAYCTCVAVDNSFRPSQPDAYLPIARMLRDSQQPKAAINLINGFHRRFPNHAATPELYLLAARIFHEDLGNEEQAHRILHYSRAAFPQSSHRPAIEHHLAVLDGPLGAAQKAGVARGDKQGTEA